jgi:hypothetical protein
MALTRFERVDPSATTLAFVHGAYPPGNIFNHRERII